MALIRAIKTGKQHLVNGALLCGAKIDNSNEFTNTLLRALLIDTNKKFNPKIIKSLLDHGAVMPIYYNILSHTLVFTNRCLEAGIIKFESNLSPEKKVNRIFEIIDLVISYKIPHKEYAFDYSWYFSILLVKNCINLLGSDDEFALFSRSLSNAYLLTFKIFDELIKQGIKPNNNDKHDDHTLSALINHLVIGINDKHKYNNVINNQIFNLLNRLIHMGALPNEKATEANTLGLAIQTKNIKLIKIICSIVSGPDTSDTEYNSLNLAIKTGDREIIEEILMIGGKPSNKPGSCTFTVSAKAVLDRDIFDLLICTGTMIPGDLFGGSGDWGKSLDCIFYDYFRRRSDHDLPDFNFDKDGENEIKIYENINDMYNHCHFFNGAYLGREVGQKFKQRIQDNMNQLVKKYSERFYKKSDLENILLSVPTCCVDLIHEYYYNQTLAATDWVRDSDVFKAYLAWHKLNFFNY